MGEMGGCYSELTAYWPPWKNITDHLLSIKRTPISLIQGCRGLEQDVYIKPTWEYPTTIDFRDLCLGNNI